MTVFVITALLVCKGPHMDVTKPISGQYATEEQAKSAAVTFANQQWSDYSGDTCKYTNVRYLGAKKDE